MKIIGLLGNKDSGKGTVADILISQYGYVPYSFATPIKDIIHQVYGIDRDILEGADKVSRVIRETPDRRLGYRTPRWAMQFIGTECFREIHPDTWVNLLFKRIDINGDQKVVITDCRRQNEVERILERSGQIWAINRKKTDPNFIQRLFIHNSERDIYRLKQRYAFYQIDNNSDIEHLKKCVFKGINATLNK